MLEALFELLFELFGQLILQLIAEALGGLFKTAWEKLRQRDKESSPAREVLWSLGTGAVAGGITVAFFPVLVLRQPWLQLLNLVAAPLVAGLLVERTRAWRESRLAFSGAVFSYAALFGLAFAGTRYVLARAMG
jgi:cytochrome bd-type quinol oxidase subunit 2